MPFGYNGKILLVDLTNGSWEIEEHGEQWYRTYWGGSALASWYMHKLIKPGVDPLSPDNVLIFAASVLTGAPVSGLSRYTVAAKNVLTGGFGESESGGFFGPELKFSGFDALVFTGKAPEPVYLWIKDGNVALRDARAHWGKSMAAAYDDIREEVGDKKARMAAIGPAGEKAARIACIISDLAHANGRCGMGAVMGSKNLKAVVCRGEAAMQSYADPEALKTLSVWHRKRIGEHPPNVNLTKFGTPSLVMPLNNSGILPTRNWAAGVFEDAEKLGADSYAKILKRSHTCYRCSVACKRVVNCTREERYGGPEYETVAGFGSMCCVSDLTAVARAHELCNAYGLDTIGAGSAVAFAMELFERDILKAADNQGRAVLFGDAEGMLALVEAMGKGEGLGSILAQGVKRAAELIGKGSEAYAFHIKGQESGFHDPRGKASLGIGIAVSPTGGDHLEAPHEPPFQGPGVKMVHPLGILAPQNVFSTGPDKVRYFKVANLTWSMNNTLGICNFTVAPLFAMSYGKLCEIVQAITGWESSLYELFLAAERSIVLARLFNYREGFRAEDDKLFSRLYEDPGEGPIKGHPLDKTALRGAINMFYEMMNWDESGVPRPAKLHELNIGWLIDDFPPHKKETSTTS